MHNPEIPQNHPELGVGQGEVPRTGAPWNHSEQGEGVHHPSPSGIHSELPGAGNEGVYYSDPPKNHSELGS